MKDDQYNNNASSVQRKILSHKWSLQLNIYKQHFQIYSNTEYKERRKLTFFLYLL